VVPPILRTRSARSSVEAKICSELLIEEQMIIAEVRTADVPVEVLGFQVERERGGQDFIELGRNFTDRVGGQIGRSVSRGAAALQGLGVGRF